jgi:mRNA interferase HicA
MSREVELLCEQALPLYRGLATDAIAGLRFYLQELERFIRAIRRSGRRRGVEVRFVTRRGKGSHGTLYYGTRKTIVKDRKKELSRGLVVDMLRQLGLDPRDLD